MKTTLTIYLALLLQCLVVGPVLAAVSGDCVNCHTMHNSQDGTSMTFNLNYSGASGPIDSLLKSDCVGCHTNATGPQTIIDLGNSRVPIVYNPGGGLQYPPNGSNNSALAGGNFYWVKQDQTTGHNVFGISAADSLLTEAPGRTVRSASSDPECANCHMTLATEESGCKGCHLAKHHADDSAEVVSGAGGWYRYLGDLMLPILTGNTSTNGSWALKSPTGSRILLPAITTATSAPPIVTLRAI